MDDQTAPDSTNGAPNSTDALADVLRQLTTDQIRFVVARHELSSDKAAAQQIGISPETVKNWKYGGAPIDEATRLMALDGIIVARDLRRRNLAKAMLVKVDGLDSKSERTKQAVASEIIEWEMGKAPQSIKQAIEGQLEMVIVDWDDNNQD